MLRSYSPREWIRTSYERSWIGLQMKASALVCSLATKFPSVFREFFTLSIRGKIPPLHHHWLFRNLASQLFAEEGFPMRESRYRLHIPRDLHPIYLGYFDFLDHERLTSKVFKRLLKTGSVVIDVGANIGHYTLLAAGAIGPRGRVHAIECSPETRSILAHNVQRNHLENVEIHPFAAASTHGTLALHVTAIGLSWFDPPSRWPTVAGGGNTIMVPTVPVDDLVSTPVDVVKIDAEGVDLDVLKGMSRILSSNQRVSVIVEWAPAMLSEAGKNPFELPGWLTDAGFDQISVLDEQYNKRRSLADTIALVKRGAFSKSWCCDLFARRSHSSVN